MMHLKMDDDEDHHHSHHEDLGPVIPPEEVPPPHDDSNMELEQDESRKRSVYDEFHEDDDEDESTKRRRKNTPPPKKLNEDQWAEMFTRLIRYKEQHGDCLVPKRYQDDPKLGTWVETQRVQYKKLQQQDGESITPNNRLNAERLEKLESAGFAWSAKNVRKLKPPAASAATPPTKKRPMTDHATRAQARQRIHDQTWTEMYERLAAYKEKYGDCLVPKKFEEDPKLASWIENQRVLYNRDFKSQEPRTSLLKREDSDLGVADPHTSEGKTPEEWAVEMDKGTPATEEDAAEVAATMAEATMEVINDVVAPMDEATMSEMAAAATSDTEAAVDSPNGDGSEHMSEKILQQVKRLSQERKEKLDALGFVWSLRSKRVDDHWDQMFSQLEEYKAKHGDCLVPSRFEENYKLGKWVETQRYEYTKLQRVSSQSGEGDDFKPGTNPRLTLERRARLEAIGFEWKVKHKMKRYYDRQWDNMFEKMLKYKAENGHCLIPKRYPPDVKLGTWVHTQRIQFRKLTTSKKEGTDDTEEGMQLGEEAQMKADEQLAQDEADMKAAVECLVEDENGEKIELKSAERQAAEEQFFRLTDERRRRLEDAGFSWSARDSEKAAEPTRITRNSYDDQWDFMFLRLKEYKEKHGHCLVPKRCKEDQKLGTWVDTQRVQYKKMRKKLDKEGMDYVPPAPVESLDEEETDTSTRKPVVGRLTDDRIRRLESLGFVWSLRDDWQKHYEELVQYKQDNGHCNVPARYAKNRRLGIWVSAQRQQYKQLIGVSADGSTPRRGPPLTQERINLLNAIGFTWTIRSRDSLGESWNQRLEDLKQYKDQFGHCLVPSRYPPNPELGIWVGTQRTQYRIYQQGEQTGNKLLHATSMNEERVRQLEELGFVWALRTGPENVWRKHFGELAEFRATHGHCAVPGNYKGNPRLGEWAVNVREAYANRHEEGVLEEEKVNELDSLGFSWIEPPQEVADATNNEVTTIVSGDDPDDDAMDDVEEDVQIFDNPPENVPPLPHDEALATGPDTVTAENLIHDAMDHAEI